MARSRRSIRLLTVGVAVFAVCCAAVLAGMLLRTHRALRQAERAVAGAGEVPFTLRPLDLRARALRFDPVAARASYTSGVELGGECYLAGAGGLTVLRADGSVRMALRTGVELPVEPVVAVIAGRLRGATEPEVLLATAGAGVLVLAPSTHGEPQVRQLLPGRAETADVSALAVTGAGDLLLGTRHAGVWSFNGTALRPLPMDGLGGVEARALEVTALAVVDSSSLLIGTRNAGVFYTHAGVVAHAGTVDGMPDEQVDSLAVAGDTAFVGTPLGVAQFLLGAGAFRPARTLAPGVFAHALAVEAGQLSVGTMDEGVVEVPLAARAHLRTASLTLGDAEGSQRVDQFVAVGGALFALADGQLLRRMGAGWTPVTATEPRGQLNDRNISALAFDDKGELFVGYFDHGLDVVEPSGSVRRLEDDSLFCVNRLVLDPRRRTMAAATANGLVLFDNNAVPRQTLRRRDGLLSEHVTDVAFTRAGTVLATPAGITYLTASGAESLYAFQGLVNNHVYALAADAGDDRVLAGTLGGLSVLDRAAVRVSYTVANSGLQHNWITALAATGARDWLVGTYGAGLQRVSAQGVFLPVELPAGTPRDLVVNPNALLVTPGHVYAGTLGHGMLVYTAATGRWRAVTEGLPSWNVTAFAERAGELYIGTENGLVRIAEAAL